jgi:O-antigen ligase
VLIDMSISVYWVPALNVSLRLLIVFISTLAVSALLIRSRRLLLEDPACLHVLVPTVIFVAASTIVNMLFSELGFVVKYLRYQIVMIGPIVLFAAMLRDRRSLQIVGSATLAIAVASSLVAVGQRIGGPFALYATGLGDPIDGYGTRAFGLSMANPVIFANSVLSVAVPTLGFLTVAWPSLPRARFPILLAALITVVGVYLSTTRSALIAIAAGMLVIAVMVDGRRQFVLCGIGLVIAAVVAASLAGGLVDQRFMEGIDEDQSAASHVAVSQVALLVALDNALIGIGRENFEKVSKAYESEVSISGSQQARRSGKAAVGALRPHNDFLEVWSSWGIAAFLAYLAVFAGTLRNCLVARRSTDPWVRGLAVGTAAGLVAYGINSAFHNYMDSSSVLWCYAGLSAGLVGAPQPAVQRLAALRQRSSAWVRGRRATTAAAHA